MLVNIDNLKTQEIKYKNKDGIEFISDTDKVFIVMADKTHDISNIDLYEIFNLQYDNIIYTSAIFERTSDTAKYLKK
jgi:hypothetical protein